MKRIIALALVMCFLSEALYAATFKAECLNSKGKMDDCKLDIKDGNLTIKGGGLNKTVVGSSITRISGGEYARRRVGESIGSAVLLGR